MILETLAGIGIVWASYAIWRAWKVRKTHRCEPQIINTDGSFGLLGKCKCGKDAPIKVNSNALREAVGSLKITVDGNRFDGTLIVTDPTKSNSTNAPED